MSVNDPSLRRKPLLRQLMDSKILLLMCLPAIVFFVVFNYMPLPGVWIAFTNFNYRDGIFGSPFVGFKNFEFLIKSGQLWTLTRNTILYNLAFIVLGNILQIAIAIMLNEIRSTFFKKISQAAELRHRRAQRADQGNRWRSSKDLLDGRCLAADHHHGAPLAVDRLRLDRLLRRHHGH